MRHLLRRAWYFIRRRRFDAELREELEFHRTSIEREFQEGGTQSTQTRFAARRAMGSVALAQDQARDVWTPRWLLGLGQDIRLAFRSFRRTPLVAFVALLSLGLGIGANTAIFSLVDGLLLRPLPVTAPQQLVTLSTPRSLELGFGAGWSYAIWQQLEQRPELFDGMAAWGTERFNLTRGGEAQLVDGLWVNGSFFDALGVAAIQGRVLTMDDDRRGGGRAGAVAVLSYGFWQRQFGGAADAIGQTITVERVPFTIVGIAPPDFFGADIGQTFDVAVPLGDEPLVRPHGSRLDAQGFYWLSIMGRLKVGQTIDAATAALRRVQPAIRAATMQANLPKDFADQYLTGRAGFALVPASTGNSRLRPQYARPLVTILVVVALVLLVACANIANLQLGRVTARRHEWSLRLALGGSRWRLARQLLTESGLLAAAGGGLGLLMTPMAGRLIIQQLSSATKAVTIDLSIDGRVLLFTIGVTVTTAVLFGVVPALRASGVAPMDALKAHGRSAGGDSRLTTSSALVVTQVAVSVVLVVAAGLFAHTFTALAARNLGFEPGRVLVVNMNAQHAIVDQAQGVPLYSRAQEAVRAVPGVSDAALSIVTPLQGGGMVAKIDVSGGVQVPATVLGGIGNCWANAVSAGWFRTLGTSIIAGRDFTVDDRADAVAIVNEALVRRFLNGANPLGHAIAYVPPQGRPLEIVGVVADSVYGSPRESVPPTVYTPLKQGQDLPGGPRPTMSLVVRSISGSPTPLIHAVAAAIVSVNPDVALTFRPLADQVNASLTQERLVAILSASFGALALLLAGLGLYGVTSYAVTRRRSEIGIRMALGAAPRSVVRLVLSRVSIWVGLGVAIGTVVSLWAARFVATLLYGLGPNDPATLVGAAVTLATVAALAGWIPAWRASRIDPAMVLRNE